jgi:uncharacterized protein
LSALDRRRRSELPLFADSFVIIEQDRIEDGEVRWQTFGMVRGVLLLIFAHTSENWDSIVRIITARKATPKERHRYKNQNG